ncbi:MAG TPA: hypothetical protein VD860_10120, partial [Azospirillum sp.]|nr:hypothetical protein [Azospirillum sp.]
GALSPGGIVPETVWRAALAWRADGLAACLDGGAVAADGTGPPAGLSTLHLGGRDGAEPAGGWIARMALYRQRLPDALLQRLTRP